jgi:DNA-binding Lrp family transcriptional regulator
VKDKILMVLREKGTPLPVGTVAKRLILSQSKALKLLEELTHAGMVKKLHLGKHPFYKIATDPLTSTLQVSDYSKQDNLTKEQ